MLGSQRKMQGREPGRRLPTSMYIAQPKLRDQHSHFTFVAVTSSWNLRLLLGSSMLLTTVDFPGVRTVFTCERMLWITGWPPTDCARCSCGRAKLLEYTIASSTT